MTPKQKEEMIIDVINARRKRYGFKTMLKFDDITPINSYSYLWAKENVEIFEKFLSEQADYCNGFKFKKDAKVEIGSEDPFYALSLGGYIKPEDILSDPLQIREVKKAIQIANDFVKALLESNIIAGY